MIPEKNLIIYRHSENNFTLTLYLRNREITFDKSNKAFIGEEIAFGSWWQFTANDACVIFEKLNLERYIRDTPIGKLTRVVFNGSDIDWESLINVKSYS